jgi:hypothetical protein
LGFYHHRDVASCYQIKKLSGGIIMTAETFGLIVAVLVTLGMAITVLWAILKAFKESQ